MPRSTGCFWRTLLLIGPLLLASSGSAGESALPIDEDEVQLGEALFLHNWARPEEWSGPEPLGDGGDGLGPVFNEVSCVACHSVGGVGGAGDNRHNVELLSVVFPPATRSQRRIRLIQRAMEMHPQIAPGNATVMLHRYGFGPDDDVVDYDSWRIGIVETALQSEPSHAAQQPASFELVPMRLSQRNTPAVWGSGLIERLRRAGGDRLRQQIALVQNGRDRGVSGRIPRTVDGRPGWYGWRGHVDHLPEFVMSACANELGLAVSNHPQPESPRVEVPRRRRGPVRTPPAQNLDLTNAQVVALTKYVGSRPRPEQVFPTDPRELDQVYAGERTFSEVGCAECHLPDFAFVKAIYSDLLLHDMGPSLSDPVSAFPEEPPPRRGPRTSSYSGGSSPSPGELASTRTRLTQEWRTPPLWGVADSPPYLHDGRAETLDEAIRLHDGEAERSAEAYRNLTDAERSQLVAFLGTLRAPQRALVASAGKP